MPFVSQVHGDYTGQVVGTGQCVAFVRQTTGAPHTSLWRCGDPVRGSHCAPGTAIATFDPDGTYGNHTDGRSHAAILTDEVSNGLMVMDQWSGHPVAPRLIRWRDGNGDAVNDGDAYYVIEVTT